MESKRLANRMRISIVLSLFMLMLNPIFADGIFAGSCGCNANVSTGSTSCVNGNCTGNKIEIREINGLCNVCENSACREIDCDGTTPVTGGSINCDNGNCSYRISISNGGSSSSSSGNFQCNCGDDSPADENTDTDGDGMPDQWENTHDLDPDADDALEDADRDGYSNLQEYKADTEPENEHSVPDSSFGFAKNLAIFGEAVCSSEDEGDDPDIAIDGDRAQSVCISPDDSGASWWQVDLKGVYDLSKINIYNYFSIIKCIVIYADISVLDANENQIYSQKVVTNGGNFRENFSIDLPGNIYGRFIRISNSGMGGLKLNEVQVFGDPAAESSSVNLALNGTASQCSTYPGYDASFANDGITDGNYPVSRGSHTHSEGNPWWRADLEDLHRLDRIVLWNRTDVASVRLSNFKVMVFDEHMDITYSEDFCKDGGTFLPNLTIELPEDTKGRYVQIQLNGKNYLHLAEVQVFGDPTPVPESERSSLVNLALNGTASKSTIYDSYTNAENAINGSLDGNYGRKSVSITHSEGNAWWQLDLKDLYRLNKIVLWRRTDGAWSYFDKLRIIVFDDKMNIRHVETIDFSDKVYPIYKSFDLPENTDGRYVRIQTDRTLSVQLSEVQVFGKPTPIPEDERSPLVNLALNGIASKSTIYNSYTNAENAINGSLDGNYGRKSVSITHSEGNAWWQLDLKDLYRLNKIVLWRRTDDGWSYFDKLRIIVFDDKMNIRHVETTDFSDKVYPIYKIFDLPENTDGRYVRIQTDRTLSVQLAEVQVFGDPTPVPESERSPLVNLATGGIASQSSTYNYLTNAENTIQDHLDGSYHRKSISITGSEGNAWWQVDLTNLYSLDNLVIWRRTDGAWHLFNNFRVLVFDDKMQVTYTEDVSFTDRVYPIYKTFKLPEGTKGQYVRVQLNGSNNLELAEIQVFGKPTPVPEAERSPVRNLAQGKPVVSSSSYNQNTSPENAVNDSLDGSWYRNALFSSKYEANPWWRVDLGANYNINRIMIWRRTDSRWSYLNNFTVSVLDETRYPVCSKKISVTDNQFPIYYDLDLTENDGKRNRRDKIPGDIIPPQPVISSGGVPGRFVLIQTEGTGYLQLAEVQVFGDPVPVPDKDVPDACDVAASVRSVASGNWSDPNIWDIGEAPRSGDWVWIEPEHTITGDIPIELGDGGICNQGTIQSAYGKKLLIQAASVHNSNDIIGQNGISRWQLSDPGSSIEIHAYRFYNDVSGKIRAGDGGNSEWGWRYAVGGAGGNVGIYTVSTINEGIIQAGDGGLGRRKRRCAIGGDGGSVFLYSDVEKQDNLSTNVGFIISGSGGDGIGKPYRAGKGGSMDLFLAELGGTIEGKNGRSVKWEPAKLKAAKDLQIKGTDIIEIYTGDNGDIDLTQLGEGAITAAKTITIAAGEGGKVNLRGLSSKVFQAGEKIKIYADEILLDEGVTIGDLADAPEITVSEGKLLCRVSLSAESLIRGNAGETVSVPFKVINAGTESDSYTFVVKDENGTELATLPPQTVKGREFRDLNISITLPADVGDTFEFTIEAVSQNDPSANAIIDVRAYAEPSEEEAADPDDDGLPNYLETESGTDPQKADSDEDGMPDGWEAAYDVNPLEDDAAADPDSDGFSNLEEYSADTDPGDAESHPDSEPQFTAGVFTVIGAEGEEEGVIKADYLFDGGLYQGELGIFSLSGMEALEPGSPEFIAEAIKRVMSDSEFGYIVIRDAKEGARFDGPLGASHEGNFNKGSYIGLKKLRMKPGDTFATVLIPDGTFAEVAKNPGTANPKKRPLFSLATANPDDGLYYGQIAGIPVEGMDNSFINAIAYEDIAADNSDRDYNDLIVQFRGVEIYSPTLDAVINREKEWRGNDDVTEHLNIPAPDSAPENHWITVTLKSPADLLVYDPEGRVIGKDGGSIPGATFEWDENGHQVITLPALDDGDYNIVLRAIGDGGLCHLEVKGFRGGEMLAAREIPLKIEPHQVLKTTLPVAAFTDEQQIAFDPPGEPVAPDGTSLAFDFDGDSDIDDTDIRRISDMWGAEEGDPDYDPFYDFDDDGRIGLYDIMSVSNSYYAEE
ncbi:hypothetical protein DENIS_0575 [Desulfonema ishimotonii]|uniref:F5/8 type C domain-containing protein n=1 Tax=Desulfonema ishimotonii TaxID=45657 RepID=A0A401FRP7_9BACT|nr:discoidin domain-containing protein [Desulfonema ishimotonii]GBC59636.1 hypothetical protein DENIS_0575 [Desulfonema ishimotonii]